GLFTAAHFDRREHIQQLVTRFQQLLQSQSGTRAISALEGLAGACFRGLRKLGMRDEIDRLLQQMADLILEGQDITTIHPKEVANWPSALRGLLHVASGWYYFGKDRQAEQVLNVARTLLYSGDLHGQAKEQTALAVAYAQAVGQAPVEVAQRRMEELFSEL